MPAHRGEANNHAKLTEQDVLAIRRSTDPVQVVADRYGVSIGTVSSVRLGRTWKHVAMPEPDFDALLEKLRRRP